MRRVTAPADGACCRCHRPIEAGEQVKIVRMGWAHDRCPVGQPGRPPQDELRAWNGRLAGDGLNVGRGRIPKGRQAKGLRAKQINDRMPGGGTHRIAGRRKRS